MEFWLQLRLDAPFASGSPYTMAYLFACPSEREPRLRQDCAEWQVAHEHIGRVILLQDAGLLAPSQGMATFSEYWLRFSQGEEPQKGIVLLDEHSDREHLILFREKTKLGGSPVWWHTEQAPACPTCGGPMRFIFQEMTVPDDKLAAAFHFGYGYLFLCTRNCGPHGALMLGQHI